MSIIVYKRQCETPISEKLFKNRKGQRELIYEPCTEHTACLDCGAYSTRSTPLLPPCSSHPHILASVHIRGSSTASSLRSAPLPPPHPSPPPSTWHAPTPWLLYSIRHYQISERERVREVNSGEGERDEGDPDPHCRRPALLVPHSTCRILLWW